jgi:hypothetical protein
VEDRSFVCSGGLFSRASEEGGSEIECVRSILLRARSLEAELCLRPATLKGV